MKEIVCKPIQICMAFDMHIHGLYAVAADSAQTLRHVVGTNMTINTTGISILYCNKEFI